MHILKPARTDGQIFARFLGDMGRMMIKNNANRRILRIMRISVFEKRNEFPAAVTWLNIGDHLATVEIKGD